MNNEEFLQIARQAADQARTIVLGAYGRLRQVEEKFQAGLVTEADKASEREIRKVITDAFPQHAFLGEEEGMSGSPDSDYIWMIDPIDGTTNYVHQLPFFAISIALEYKGEMVLGLVDAPALGDQYHALKGGGAYRNGERITISPRDRLADALVATGFSSQSKHDLHSQVLALEGPLESTRGVRRLGSAALDLCLVACGVFDAFWEKHLSPWDTAAGTVLVREAGGLVQSFDSLDYEPRMKTILAGNPKILSPLRGALGLKALTA